MGGTSSCDLIRDLGPFYECMVIFDQPHMITSTGAPCMGNEGQSTWYRTVTDMIIANYPHSVPITSHIN